MDPNEYKESLQQAAAALVNIREQLFNTTFQVAITGELKEWSDTIPEGEQVTFSKEVFAGCDDANVQLLTGLLDAVERTCDSLLNLNHLELEDE